VRPVIAFLTDFGLDGAAATCRGVMLSICRDAQIIDVSHTIRKYSIRDGAFILRAAMPFMPVGVHVGVVDPGVGTARRPIAIRTARGDVLIGPDNGLLLPAAEAIGGAAAARELTNRDLWLPGTTATFHGRDIFAPVAAHLAAGTPIGEVGPAIDPAELVRLDLPRADLREGGFDTSVLFVDAFGNCRLAGQPPDLAALRSRLEPGDRFTVRIGSTVHEMPWQPTFGAVEAGAPLLYEDADYAGLAIGINRGSAAERLGLDHDTPVRIEPA